MSGIGQSPSKRRRLSDELDDGDEADVISLSVCSRHRDEEQEGDSGVLLVQDHRALRCRDAVRGAQILSGTGRGASLCSCGELASIVADVFEHEDGLALEKGV